MYIKTLHIWPDEKHQLKFQVTQNLKFVGEKKQNKNHKGSFLNNHIDPEMLIPSKEIIFYRLWLATFHKKNKTKQNTLNMALTHLNSKHFGGDPDGDIRKKNTRR